MEILRSEYLSNDAELSFGFKGIQHHDDILMLQLLKNIYFPSKIHQIFLRFSSLRHEFKSHNLPGMLAPAFENFSEGSFTNGVKKNGNGKRPEKSGRTKTARNLSGNFSGQLFCSRKLVICSRKPLNTDHQCHILAAFVIILDFLISFDF